MRPFSVDPERLETWLRRRRVPAGIRFVWWFLRRWVLFAAFFYLFAGLGAAWLDGEIARALEISGKGLLRNLVLPLGMGLLINLVGLRTQLRQARESPASLAREIEAEWAELVRPRWPLRTLATGLVMGLGIGLLVGPLLAFGLPPDERPAGGPAVIWLSFVGLTLLWTIPMAFLLRWGTLRFYRRLSRRAAPA